MCMWHIHTHMCNAYFPMYFHLAANKSRVDFIENFFGYFATFLLSHSTFIWFLSIILKHFKKFCTAPNTNHVDKYWFTHMNPAGERTNSMTDSNWERRSARERALAATPRQGQVLRQVEGSWVRWITFAGHSVQSQTEAMRSTWLCQCWAATSEQCQNGKLPGNM